VGDVTGPTASERREKRVAISCVNPVFFGETYIRPYDDNWDGPMPAVPRQMLAFAMAVRRGVVMTPPEFLKTTTISQVYPLWLTYRYAQAGKLSMLHGALMSELQELAERNLSVIAWHIENNPDLARDFVDVHGRPLVEPDPDQDKWTDEEIIVRRPTPSKDPTWQAKGVKTTIQGARLNHFIGDDLVTPGSAKSVAKQRDALNRWDTEVTTRLVATGQALIAGNFNHPRDLLSTVAARGAYRVLRRPSLHVAGKPEEAPEDPRDPTAVVALPEKWPRERVLGELSEKPFTFPVIHLLRAAQKGGTALREGWVTRISLDQIPALQRTTLFSIDPAPGAEVDPDPSFFTITVGILTPKHLDIVQSYAARMEATEQVELLSAMVASRREEGHVGGIGISKVALDKYARGAFEVGDPTLRPILHPHSVGEGSKIERLAHLGSYFKGGWARVTEDAWMAKTSGPDDREQETTLAEEWTTLPMQRHDDRLDGVDVLIREALSIGGGPGAPQTEFAGEQDRDADIEAPITAGILDRRW
jgi:hypothetical protein